MSEKCMVFDWFNVIDGIVKFEMLILVLIKFVKKDIVLLFVLEFMIDLLIDEL